MKVWQEMTCNQMQHETLLNITRNRLNRSLLWASPALYQSLLHTELSTIFLHKGCCLCHIWVHKHTCMCKRVQQTAKHASQLDRQEVWEPIKQLQGYSLGTGETLGLGQLPDVHLSMWDANKHQVRLASKQDQRFGAWILPGQWM